MGTVSLAIFIFSSFWIYHYIDLDHEFGSMDDAEAEAEMLREHDALRF